MRLVVLDGQAAQPEFVIDQDVAIIGRAHDCDVVLHDQEASRRHARIRLVDGRYVIEDVEAANRTVVNDHLLDGTRPLSDGDVILIGGVLLQARIEDAPASPPEPVSAETVAAIDSAPPRADAVAMLRDAQARLARVASRLDGWARQRIGGEQDQPNPDDVRARLHALEANHAALGGSPEVQRLTRILAADPARHNQTSVSSLYPVADEASTLARWMRLARSAQRVFEMVGVLFH